MSELSHAARRICVAVDTKDLDHAVALAGSLADHVGWIKLGKEFFMSHGPAGVRAVADTGLPIFLDLKFHDIPNTVAGAVSAVTPLGVGIVNVHATGGSEMMKRAKEAAVETAAKANVTPPLVIAVTVLTSLDEGDLADVGLIGPAADRVSALAALTEAAGLDGVVCSAREAKRLKSERKAEFQLITPGIRPAWAAAGDQKRVVTPADAIADGADILVIGRPITGAESPAEAAQRIAEEINA